MKALLVPPLILLTSAVASGQIVVFPNRVTTVEKLPPELRAYREAARRLSGSSSRPCEGPREEHDVAERAKRALLLEVETPLDPFEYRSRSYVRIEVLNKYPFLGEPPAVKKLEAKIKKTFEFLEESDLLWFAFAGKAFVSTERPRSPELPGGELAWKPGDPMVSRLLAWSAWVTGKPDLCFEQAERLIEWDPSVGDPPICFFGDWGADILVTLLVSPEGLIFACAACAEIDSPKVPIRVADLKFLAPCGSPFAKAASSATVYAPDPDLNGVVLRFRNSVRGSNFWFLPAWGGKMQPLKTYEPKLPTSR